MILLLKHSYSTFCILCCIFNYANNACKTFAVFFANNCYFVLYNDAKSRLSAFKIETITVKDVLISPLSIAPITCPYESPVFSASASCDKPALFLSARRFRPNSFKISFLSIKKFYTVDRR